MKRRVLGMLMLMTSAVAFAQKPAVVTSNKEGWQKIGETTASFKTENESIAVLGADEFSAIKIKVVDVPVEVQRLQVFYESGDMEEVNVKESFDANGESRAISLEHPDRDIQKVAFTYKTSANAKGEKAKIELYGLKAGQPMGSDSYRDNKEKVDEEVDNASENANRSIERAEDDVEDGGRSRGENRRSRKFD